MLPNSEIYLVGGTNTDKTKSGSIYLFDEKSKKLVLEND